MFLVLGMPTTYAGRNDLLGPHQSWPIHWGFHLHWCFVDSTNVERNAIIVPEWTRQFFGLHNGLLCRKLIIFFKLILHFYNALTTFQIFLHARMTWRGSKLLKNFIQYGLILFSWFTCMTRISDYKHHWSDVLAGAALGTIVALTVVRLMRLNL